MSSVKQNDRNKAKTEFDNAYFKIHDDAIFLIKHRFGAKEKTEKALSDYIDVMSKKVYAVVCDIGTYIRIANSIYPQCKEEYKERRVYQDKAIGLCFDLITKYQLIMKTLNVKGDKYVTEIRHISHEINVLKSWRASDNKRFKNLG